MNLPDFKADQLAQMRNRSSRRAFLRNVGLAAAAAPLAASLFTPSTASAAPNYAPDADVFNFALNLEYLEAEFYAKAYYGAGLVELGVIPASVGATVTYPVTDRVTFNNPFIYNYASEITNDEIAHVVFLRNALGSLAINEPTIDLQNSFNALAQATGLGNTFDPYSSEENFLLGAFIFEDVGVTAYHGAAGLLVSKDSVPPASGILSVEAYHASIVRTTLFNLNFGDPNGTLANAVNLISQLRDSLDGSGSDDQGITSSDGTANIVPTDASSICFARNKRQVLNIVYGAPGVSKGGFFPDGVNTTPTTSVS